jgi:hypothetical protein
MNQGDFSLDSLHPTWEYLPEPSQNTNMNHPSLDPEGQVSNSQELVDDGHHYPQFHQHHCHQDNESQSHLYMEQPASMSQRADAYPSG